MVDFPGEFAKNPVNGRKLEPRTAAVGHFLSLSTLIWPYVSGRRDWIGYSYPRIAYDAFGLWIQSTLV